MRRTIAPIAIALVAATAAPAGAAVTATEVTSPAGNPVVLDPNLDIAAPLQASGTATGNPGDQVSIRCAYDNGAGDAVDDLGTGALDGSSSFSIAVDQHDFNFYICRLIAVPAGSSAPFDLTKFKGPVVSNNGFLAYRFDGGSANDGKLFDYFQQSSALRGYWSVYSAGDCFVEDSYPVEPGSLNFGDRLFACSWIPQGGFDGLTVDGAQGFLPYAQSDLPGFTEIRNWSHSISAQDGTMRLSDIEPVATCGNPCSTYQPTGVELHQKQIGGAAGNTLRVIHRWVNTTGQAKQLQLEYDVDVSGPDPEFRFVNFDGLGPTALEPSSFFVNPDSLALCESVSDPCGSVSWYRAPDSIDESFSSAGLRYTLTLPPGSARTLAFVYSQGFPQSAVDGFAAAAEAGFETEFLFGKPKRNRRRGTAALPIRLPGAGRVTVRGKGIRPINRQLTGNAKLRIRPKGKVRRRLNRRGRARVRLVVTYARPDLDPVSKRRRLVLIKRRRR